MNRRLELALIAFFLLLASLLRTWDLTRLPPGFTDDELAYIHMTETIRQGEVAVYYHVSDERGRAGMYAILNTLVTGLVGDGLLGYRVLSLWSGLVALAALYTLARRLFGIPVALVALGLMSVNLRAVLLSRTATAEALVPLYTLLTLLALAVAFNLRREVRFHTPLTLPFALLALLFGASGYLHYTALALGPLGALFFAHLLITHQPLSRRLWSTGIFVIVLATVVAVPYVTSTLREPANSEPDILAALRPDSPADLVDGALRAVGGIIWQGDARVTHNRPDAALIGPAMAIPLLVGLAEALRRWREPRYALVLLALGGGLLTDTWVRVAPDFSANLVALPALYLLPGIGVGVIAESLRRRGVARAWEPVTLVLVVVLVAGLLRLPGRLFDFWRHDHQVAVRYHANLGRLAAYLDRTPGGLPVSMCSIPLRNAEGDGPVPRQVLGFMLHRENLSIRHSDCRAGLVFVNAGAPMRFIFADPADRAQMPPELADWLKDAVPIPVEGLAEGTVLHLDLEQRIRDAGGTWATTAPVFFQPYHAGIGAAAELPVTFERNLTFAGYDPRVFERAYTPGGDPVVLVTYWRVDGELPPDLGFFAHLLAYWQDPQSGQLMPLLEPWAESNSMEVIPARLQNRDFFVQVSYLWPGDLLKPGLYALTLGAYNQVPANHLGVLDRATGQLRGDWLLLGDIQIDGPENDS